MSNDTRDLRFIYILQSFFRARQDNSYTRLSSQFDLNHNLQEYKNGDFLHIWFDKNAGILAYSYVAYASVIIICFTQGNP